MPARRSVAQPVDMDEQEGVADALKLELHGIGEGSRHDCSSALSDLSRGQDGEAEEKKA